MVRSLWIRTLATTLVWTGVAWAQQPSPASGDQTEQILTIQETGKGPQNCKVVKSWRTGDGRQAYQVRALDTGEMMTITEKATASSKPGGKPLSIATQIFHWGAAKLSPPGVPAPANDPPVAVASSGSKSSARPSPSVTPSFSAQVPDVVKPGGSPYASSNKPISSPAVVDAKNTSAPVPAKDWRQSWAKTDDKPLELETKPIAKDSVAAVPLPRIESKIPSKDVAFELPPIKSEQRSSLNEMGKPSIKQDERPGMKQPAYQPKISLSADDPLLNPEKFVPKVLDLTPRAKISEKAVPSSPVAPAPSRVPTIADIASAKSESKAPAAVDKSITVPDTNKMAGAPIVPPLPARTQPGVASDLPPVPEKAMKEIDSKKLAGPATIPALPATVPSSAVPTPLDVVGPTVSLATPPLAPMVETRAERPNFLVMEADRSGPSDRAIKLPGVPGAIVAFGQPVLVTAPPPDLVRKKSLEAHSIRVMLGQLEGSLYPSQREWAAEGLASANWKAHPQVVDALCAAAVADPASSVRGRCVLSLASMHVRSETALEVIHKLETDKDDSVRARAAEALEILESADAKH